MSLRPNAIPSVDVTPLSPRGASKRPAAGNGNPQEDLESAQGSSTTSHGNNGANAGGVNGSTLAGIKDDGIGNSKHAPEGPRRRKHSFRRTSYGVVVLTALTLYVSIALTNYAVFDVLGGKRDIQFASLLWGIINTAVSCMNLSILRNGVVPLLAKVTAGTTEATRMLFDDTLAQPMSRLWIGLFVGVCFTYAATGFDLPPWPQLRFSATSYMVAVAWSFSLLSTFQQLSSGE